MTEATSVKAREIPLLVQHVFLPAFGEESEPVDKVISRLDQVTECDPSQLGVAAAVLGAKTAGRTAGYEFTPVYSVVKGEKARDAISKLDTKSDVVMLLRVSSSTANLGNATLINMFADAALYKKTALVPILNAGFMAVERVDPGHVKDNEVDSEYWMQTAATAFVREFDLVVLAKMQESMDGEQIAAGLSKLKQAASQTLKPTSTSLERAATCPPQLCIRAAKPDTQGVVYLLQDSGKSARRWNIGSSAEVDVTVRPGKYAIYGEAWSSGAPNARRAYRADLTVEFNNRYLLNVE
jgi:hypothetical protein